MAGERPFFVSDDHLCLTFKPILPSWLFNQDNAISFKFLGCTTIIYHNPKRSDTFNPRTVISSMMLHPFGGDSQEIIGAVIPAPFAQHIREGQIKQIDVYFA